MDKSQIISSNPIGNRLNPIHESFNSICRQLQISNGVEALHQFDNNGKINYSHWLPLLTYLDLLKLAYGLVSMLLSHPASQLLPSQGIGENLYHDVAQLGVAITSPDFDFDRIKPLLTAIINNESDEVIWEKVYDAIIESTPPPRPAPSSIRHTTTNTGSVVNTTEYCKQMDALLKKELIDTMFVDVAGFYEAYFGDVAGLEPAAKAVFARLTEEKLYQKGCGWKNWPTAAAESDVLKWISWFTNHLLRVSRDYRLTETKPRPFAQPNKPLNKSQDGTAAVRKLDVGFMDIGSVKARSNTKYSWSQVLVAGELKSNVNKDILSQAWLDLGKYAREVFAAQDTRRYILGFTLCGSLMRLWVFDRLGGIASTRFDINEDGLDFVSVMLGFLKMNTEQLGFDPTILKTSDGRRYVEVKQHGETKRIILDKVIKRRAYVAGRATTCWKGRIEDDDSIRRPVVVKDSWQYPERQQEGELLRKATEKKVLNVARYYHHETVYVKGEEDNVCDNVRKGLKITKENSAKGRQGKKHGHSSLKTSQTVELELCDCAKQWNIRYPCG